MAIGNLAVALIALIAIALAKVVSGWIGRSSREANAEAGPGDAPGGPDRGPDGMKM
jgi:hypothetical protein